MFFSPSARSRPNKACANACAVAKFRPKQTGFTLIELVVAIVILAILTALAAPSFANLLSRNKTRTAANLLQENLRQARYESRAQQGSTILFCALRGVGAPNNERCSNNNTPTNFEFGWQWFIDDDNDGVFNSTDDTLLGRSLDAIKHDISVSVTPQSTTNNILAFNRGKPSFTDLPVFTFDDNNSTTVATLSYNATGRTILTAH